MIVGSALEGCRRRLNPPVSWSAPAIERVRGRKPFLVQGRSKCPSAHRFLRGAEPTEVATLGGHNGTPLVSMGDQGLLARSDVVRVGFRDRRRSIKPLIDCQGASFSRTREGHARRGMVLLSGCLRTPHRYSVASARSRSG